MPTCSNCQAEVSTAASSCPDCGAVFGSTETTAADRSTRATSKSLPDQFTPQQLVRVAQGLAGLSIICSLVVVFTPQSALGGRSGGLLLPALILVWLVTFAGLWKRTDSGVIVGIAGYGLATVISVLGVARLLLGRVGPASLRLLPMDPASLLLRAIYSFQLSSGGIPRVRSVSFLIAGLIGTVSVAAVTALLVRDRDALVVTSRTEAGQQPSVSSGSSAGRGSMVSLSGIIVGTSVVVVLVASLVGWNGFESTPIAVKVISAGFPSLLAAVIGYVSIAQPAAFDSSINVALVALIGVVMPLAVTLDAVVVRRRTDWTPSLFWYPIGVLFVWFLALPVYLYRRSTHV